ncbi:MAG: hypothetical protein RMZ43_022400 [Nostoc sp. CmiVER01]|uniref:hypothetical protein n=1 Tax=Nostoc sp. CmiVER01 TaxID=3075384 RepID=UPI002AD2531E|nr:hypothetical protein [Nostoc sp. CmiVER01]MDZ8122853.1 hypothetical protein [Nostoc sp. CmiVER01]
MTLLPLVEKPCRWQSLSKSWLYVALTAVAHREKPQTLDNLLTLRYRPWRLPLREDRAALPKFKIPLEKFCSLKSDA